VKKYDYVIVGAGLFGSTFARQALDNGKKVLIIDKRNHTAGNCYSEKIDGIEVHTYGPHVFHTDNTKIWNYANRFAEFNNFTYRPRVNYRGNIYSFPINLMTLYQVWGVKTPEEASRKLEEVKVNIKNPKNLEEWILSQVGEELYEIFIKGYTVKQWNRDPKDLPSFIIKRLPIRLTYNDNYFNDRYQGVPVGGYTKMLSKMIEGADLELEVDYFSDRKSLDRMCEKIVFTGKIDEYFDYSSGLLEYRTIKFDHRRMKGDYQGNVAINYTDVETPYTRTIEHKHFEFLKSDNTVVTFEYPDKWDQTKIPLYPVNDKENTKIFKLYKDASEKHCKNVIFGGRLAEYRYYDMHQVIGSAISKAKRYEGLQ